MADVSIKYKGSTIAEMAATGTKTLKTAGTYCEGDISVDYAPRCKTYEITLPKAYNWVLLTTLDAEVLEHINDETLVVTLTRTSPFEYVWYAGDTYMVTNRQIGLYQERPQYGYANRNQSETNYAAHAIRTPANSTSREVEWSDYAQFLVENGKYYIMPSDGYIKAGNYRLTFTW